LSHDCKVRKEDVAVGLSIMKHKKLYTRTFSNSDSRQYHHSLGTYGFHLLSWFITSLPARVCWNFHCNSLPGVQWRSYREHV